MEIHSLQPTLPHIPDDQTIGQFTFSHGHPAMPHRKEGTPWLIEDATGRSLGELEVIVCYFYGRICR